MGDIALVSNLAVSIYKSSKQAGKEFRSIADDGELLDLSGISTLILDSRVTTDFSSYTPRRDRETKVAHQSIEWLTAWRALISDGIL